MPVAAFPMPAAVSPKHVVKADFQKRVFVDIRNEVNAAATTAIAAAGAALRDELFPTECNASVTPVPRFDCNFGFVDEHFE